MEQILKNFGITKSIKIVADNMPISRSAQATLFFSEDLFYVLIESQAKINFGQVKKILNKANIVPHKFLMPIDKPNYLSEQATELFCQTYPGMKPQQELDLIYFKTLVAYTPALIEIKHIKQGKVLCFDEDSREKWRLALKINYTKLAIN